MSTSPSDAHVGALTQEAALAALRETLHIEAETLLTAAARMGESFLAALRTILACNGKVIVTGLGKSGHVGRKVAATLASTGTPAFFLHPSEALHGDLGMVGHSDVLLALAFGGETREVIEVAKFAHRNGVPILAVTGSAQSTLARIAHVVLDGSVAREACPLNLAPTSSSILAMAIGDALAVALMRARGFRDVDFARLHPEGSLGRKLATVFDYMRLLERRMILIPDAPFETVLEAVMSLNYGIAVVLGSDGKLAGVITDGDVRRAVAIHRETVFTKKASDLMSRSPKTINGGDLAIDAVQAMESAKITALLVFGDGGPQVPIGIIRMHDLLTAKVV